MKVLILYYTKTGHTLEAVNPMAEGIRSAGSEAVVVSVDDFDTSMMADYDAFIAGSPCWAGVVSKNGAAAPMEKALKTLPDGCLKGKICGGIAIHAFKGGNNTLSHLERLLADKGCENYKPGPVGKAGAPAGITAGKPLSGADAERFKAYGAEFVK